MLIRILAVTAIVPLLVGCESNRTESEYGQAVRQMINAQVYNPATLTTPSDKPVEGADPDMVINAIEALREHVSKPEDVAGQDIVIQVGDQGG
jgi:hypothetical protein